MRGGEKIRKVEEEEEKMQEGEEEEDGSRKERQKLCRKTRQRREGLENEREWSRRKISCKVSRKSRWKLMGRRRKLRGQERKRRRKRMKQRSRKGLGG